MTLSLQECQARDAQDPLRALRQHFSLPPGVIYLDGNSLGALPAATAARVAEVVAQEWGKDLIKAWNTAGWISLSERLGNQFAPWIGAGPGQLVFTDTTSINLYKVLTAAARVAQADQPGRKKLISERSNFPTDLYIAQSVCAQHGLELVLLEPDEIDAALTPDVAICMLTQSTTAPAPCTTWPPSRRARTRKASSACGTCATARARCRSTCSAPTPTTPWVAATSI